MPERGRESERNFKALRLRCSLAENSLELSTEEGQQHQQHLTKVELSRDEGKSQSQTRPLGDILQESVAGAAPPRIVVIIIAWGY